jgi:hypothetical protein
MMKKLYIETYGCQMNVADSEVVASVMQMAGYETTETLDEADAVFLNTCSVRDNAEQKIFHRLEALDAERRKRQKTNPENPRMLIGVLDVWLREHNRTCSTIISATSWQVPMHICLCPTSLPRLNWDIRQ